MKATLKLEDGREIQVELSDKDVDAIIKPKKTGWERVKPKEFYFCIWSDGQVSADEDEGDDIDKHWYTIGNYFSDEQLANDQARAISLWLRIKRWAAEHCEPVDWLPKDDEWSCKYGITFLSDIGEEHKILPAIQTVTRRFGNVYFDTEEHAEKCIEEFKDELMWYFTECRDRMDG